MSHKIGTMREFKTKNFRVVCDAIEEEDLDLSFDEDGSTLRGLQSGEFIAFVARVRVFFNGAEVGSDYLGGCIYKSLEDFMDHKECGAQNAKYARQEKRRKVAEGSLGRCGSYFSQMITTAIEEARKTILSQQAVYIRKAVKPCSTVAFYNEDGVHVSDRDFTPKQALALSCAIRRAAMLAMGEI